MYSGGWDGGLITSCKVKKVLISSSDMLVVLSGSERKQSYRTQEAFMRSRYAWHSRELGSLEDAELALGIELFWRRTAFLDCSDYSLGQYNNFPSSCISGTFK